MYPLYSQSPFFNLFTNQCPAISSIDILERSVTPEGTLITRRLICTEFRLPDWIRKIVGETKTYVLEESEVNAVTKIHSMRSKNISLNKIMNFEESLVYMANPLDNMKTIMRQEARINVCIRFGEHLESQVMKPAVTLQLQFDEILCLYALISHFLREFPQVLNQITKTASKGRDAIDFVARQIELEGRQLVQAAEGLLDDITGVTNIESECAEIESSTKLQQVLVDEVRDLTEGLLEVIYYVIYRRL